MGESWGGFGPITKGSRRLGIPNPTGKVGEPGGWRVGDKAGLEVEKYLKDGGYLILKVTFQPLTREIFENTTKKKRVDRMEKSAVQALQMAAETYMALVFNS